MAMEHQLFKKLSGQLNNKLPFVSYRKPKEKAINLLTQNDDNLHFVCDYEESGFVFAPFDQKKPAVIIPFDPVFFSVYKDVQVSLLVPQPKKDAVLETSKKSHIDLVSKGIDRIDAGLLTKVVLSRKLEIEINGMDAVQLFQNLLASYPNAFCYIWYHPKVGLWLGATPETLLNIKGSRLSTMALAGTQSYKGTLDVDWGAKEIEEQQLVTDFVVRGLKSAISSQKGVTVSRPMTVRAGSLLHLQTMINADLQVGNGVIAKLLVEIHPTPAVCGFPKNEARQFIVENEGYDREYYTGFLGELSLNSASQSSLFVNLRCMQLKDGKAIIYIGGGITKDSIPSKEWRETVSKAGTMLKVLFK